MSKIDSILTEMREVVDHPGRAVEEFKKKTGKKAIGCLPYYIPEEIVHAGGMLPVGVWGGQTTITRASKYLPSFACSIMQGVMELALKGVYDGLSAAIIPAYCDTLKCIGENWKVAIPQVKCIGLIYPQNRKIEAGVKFLEAEFDHVRSELEEVSGEKISDDAISRSIEVYNQYRRTMREFCEVAADYPVTITPSVRHTVIKAGYFRDKAEQTAQVKDLIIELKKLPAEKWNGSKVVIAGIMAEPDEYLNLFDEYHLAIAADDLAQESRQFRTDVPAGSNPIERLARWWSIFSGCSLAYDPTKARGPMLIDMVKKYKADAVVISMMKFCEPEEFDYPIIKKELEAANIPCLYVEMDQQMQSVEQLRTRIQGFSELLKTR